MMLTHDFSKEDIARFKCLDCGVNVIEMGDWYMCRPEIWDGRGPDLGEEGNLCIARLEARFGRKLRGGFLDVMRAGFVKDVELPEAAE